MGEDSPKPVVGQHEQERIAEESDTNYELRIDEDDENDEEDEEDEGEWYPGDGVCPSTSEFDACQQLSFDLWKRAALARSQGSESIDFYIEALLKLVKDVPPLFHSPPDDLKLLGGSNHLFLRPTLLLEMTDAQSCDQRQKSIEYIQFLAFKPAVYKVVNESQCRIAIPIHAAPIRSGYLTSIALAWSYVISCRWVEILQQAGHKSRILHDPEKASSFWDMITQSGWVARVTYKKRFSYSPWMLQKERDTLGTKKDGWKSVAPDSLLAFETLLEFCISEGFEGELITGFVSVLMLTTRNASSPKLAPPVMISRVPSRFQQKDTTFHRLFKSMDKLLFLSSILDAFDSLLCSAFFDPSVPCNLLGAASSGIRRALSKTDEIDSQSLLNAITELKPHLSLLWAAVICSHQEMPFIREALRSLPPLCIVAGFLTNTLQSFLQVGYHSDGLAESIIPRAYEFQTSYFCRQIVHRQDVHPPWSPAPPFGTTTATNLSLDVRAHIDHKHRPISWTLYWNLKSGSRVPASAQHRIIPGPVHHIQSSSGGPTEDFPCPARRYGDEQSWGATSRLFNWHRCIDGGLWLDDGSADIKTIRRLQIHPWIDLWDDDDGPVEETKIKEPCRETISQWCAEVEEQRNSGEICTP